MATVMASKSRVLVPVLLDDEDAALLPGKVSIGSHGYGQIWADRRVQVLHRWILGLGLGDKRIGDHINGDRLDNRRTNLRIVNASQSSSNVKSRAASGYRGVYPNRARTRWVAKAKFQGKMINLGTYDDPEVAAEVSRQWRIANLSGYIDGR
jgi:hypothetical protein